MTARSRPTWPSELRVGDQLELRGPIGGYFVWEPSIGGPLLLVAGGSGVVPLMAMLRAPGRGGERRAGAAAALVALDGTDHLPRRAGARSAGRTRASRCSHPHRRAQPPGWTGYAPPVDRDMLAEVAWPVDEAGRGYVCGPTGLVEARRTALIELGHDPARIRTERFGPTGGTA